jgi:hypothetical protein
MAEQDKTCFVIMPYGRKPIHGGVEVDFDLIYSEIIKKAVDGIDEPRLVCERSIDNPRVGLISEAFTKSIFEADVAIIDVSGANANVYYELGMRHALKPRISLLIGVNGTQLPFDIAGILVLPYGYETAEERASAAAMIRSQLIKSLASGHTDSPVHNFLPRLSVSLPDRVHGSYTRVDYDVEGAEGFTLGYVTGALTDVRGIDVWVNSENTQMEMARPYERSVSSLIRYYGAVRHADGRIRRDVIQEAVRKQLHGLATVAPGTVIDTEPGELEHWGVRRLLHVASVEGQPGLGYRPIQNVRACATNVLEHLARLNHAGREAPLGTVLMPILGTGTGGGDPKTMLEDLVASVLHFGANRRSGVTGVHFLAYTERQIEVCEAVLGAMPRLRKRHAAPASSGAATRSETPDAAARFDFSRLSADLRRAKDAARTLRQAGDEAGAIQALQTTLATVGEGGWRALLDGGRDGYLLKREAAWDLADCCGVLGGALRRAGRLTEALAVFRRGEALELDPSLELPLSYNLVNGLITEIESGAPRDPVETDREVARAISTLERQLAGPRADDIWAWADFGACQILRGNRTRARDAYDHFARMAFVDAVKSARTVLTSLSHTLGAESDPRAGLIREVLERLPGGDAPAPAPASPAAPL